MTDVAAAPTPSAIAEGVLDELTAEVDEFLRGTINRSLVPSAEVQAFALDLRIIVTKGRDALNESATPVG